MYFRETPQQALEMRAKAARMIWLDLELTELDDPQIMECAVIITDEHLNEIASATWVVHFDEAQLAALGEWHQRYFAAPQDGGNGLIKDCLESTLTTVEMEEQLLAFLQEHCFEGVRAVEGG